MINPLWLAQRFPLLAVLFALVALGVVIALAAASTRRRRALADRARFLQQLAATHGLPPDALHFGADDTVGLTLPDPFAFAHVDAASPPPAPPYLETRTRNGRGATVITASVRAVPVELTVRPELFGEALDKALGTTIDHELGDPAFDRAFVVAAAPPELARAVLGPRARAALLALRRDSDSPRLAIHHDGTHAHLALHFTGEPDPARVMPLLSALREIGLAVAELREGIAVDSAAPFRAAGGEGTVDPARRHGALAALAAARWRFVALVMALLGAGGVVAAAVTSASLR